MNYQKIGGRMPVDPRIISEIESSPQMRAEQGINFMSDWGGSEAYGKLAGVPIEARVTYAAVLAGITVPAEIEAVTGLSAGEVSVGMTSLRKMGLIGKEVLAEPI